MLMHTDQHTVAIFRGDRLEAACCAQEVVVSTGVAADMQGRNAYRLRGYLEVVLDRHPRC